MRLYYVDVPRHGADITVRVIELVVVRETPKFYIVELANAFAESQRWRLPSYPRIAKNHPLIGRTPEEAAQAQLKIHDKRFKAIEEELDRVQNQCHQLVRLV